MVGTIAWAVASICSYAGSRRGHNDNTYWEINICPGAAVGQLCAYSAPVDKARMRFAAPQAEAVSNLGVGSNPEILTLRRSCPVCTSRRTSDAEQLAFAHVRLRRQGLGGETIGSERRQCRLRRAMDAPPGPTRVPCRNGGPCAGAD